MGVVSTCARPAVHTAAPASDRCLRRALKGPTHRVTGPMTHRRIGYVAAEPVTHVDGQSRPIRTGPIVCTSTYYDMM